MSTQTTWIPVRPVNVGNFDQAIAGTLQSLRLSVITLKMRNAMSVFAAAMTSHQFTEDGQDYTAVVQEFGFPEADLCGYEGRLIACGVFAPAEQVSKHVLSILTMRGLDPYLSPAVRGRLAVAFIRGYVSQQEEEEA